jgi:hypothetical protein
MIAPGIYKDLSNDEYHQDEGSISRTGMSIFNESPYRYWAHYINPARPGKKMTPAMEFGKVFHEFILEPEEFNKHYVIKPTKVLLKNVGRVKYDEYKRICADLEESNYIVLDDEDYVKLLEMRHALMKHSEARELIEGAIYEQSYFWKDEHSGLMVKARPDILHRNMIVDLKTCSDPSPRGFSNAMAYGGYHIQGAIIRDGVRELEGRDIPNVINIAIEPEYPYSVAVYPIHEEALEIGHQKYKQTLLDMKQCFDSKVWPDYEIQTINLPRWALQ